MAETTKIDKDQESGQDSRAKKGFLKRIFASNITRKTKIDELKKDVKKEMNELVLIRKNFLALDLKEFLDRVVDEGLRARDLDFQSYFLPLSFFLFMYLSGFLITIPLINSIFTGIPSLAYIPVFNQSQYVIPLTVVQWGFLGGFVYTSIGLLNRFLRKDITPSVYFHSSFRLLMSAVVAIIIFFLYMAAYPNDVGKDDLSHISPFILLVCFVAGAAPISLLIHFADTQLSRVTGWKRRNTSGNRSLTQLEGINTITAERLSDAGIDCIQQMALSDPAEVEKNTKFPLSDLKDWKDQAVLYILTGDVTVGDKNSTEILNDRLRKKLQIRTFSDLKNSWQQLSASGTNEDIKDWLTAIDSSLASPNLWSTHLFRTILENGKMFYVTKGEPKNFDSEGGVASSATAEELQQATPTSTTTTTSATPGPSNSNVSPGTS